MKTKVLSLVLAALLIISVFGVLAACGSDADKTATTAPTTVAATTAATTAPAANNSNSAVENNNVNGGSDQSNNAVAATTAPANSTSSDDVIEIDDDEDTNAAVDFEGDTVLSAQQAIDTVLAQYDDTYTAQYYGVILVQDGTVWHNVVITDAEGQSESLYVADTTGTIKTVSELGAFVNR